MSQASPTRDAMSQRRLSRAYKVAQVLLAVSVLVTYTVGITLEQVHLLIPGLVVTGVVLIANMPLAVFASPLLATGLRSGVTLGVALVGTFPCLALANFSVPPTSLVLFVWGLELAHLIPGAMFCSIRHVIGWVMSPESTS